MVKRKCLIISSISYYLLFAASRNIWVVVEKNVALSLDTCRFCDAFVSKESSFLFSANASLRVCE